MSQEIQEDIDPVLAMAGIGRQLWERESGEAFIERLRSEEVVDPPADQSNDLTKETSMALHNAVWTRILQHQNEPFETVTGLPLTYQVEGNGIWFFRGGKRINRKLTRTQVDVAVSRCPLSSTTEISDLIDYPYLFALLKDGRIRNREW